MHNFLIFLDILIFRIADELIVPNNNEYQWVRIGRIAENRIIRETINFKLSVSRKLEDGSPQDWWNMGTSSRILRSENGAKSCMLLKTTPEYTRLASIKEAFKYDGVCWSLVKDQTSAKHVSMIYFLWSTSALINETATACVLIANLCD